ncbi:ABC transporter permease subunit [Trebonia kvetii]|uniref:ABC transporter permease subunit n=1 Tax=Trebonia kvetii TaxID=2480626 RepID=A0A6P2C402_9ACTN|nr:ABC transporter permease subunit [Trebonia kvetii]TVZ05186.1 ABC transporter permease subunit [Trebonia kvetii]
MAAVATERTPAPAPVAAARPRRRSVPVWRWVVMLIAAVYFLLPLFAALRFAGIKAFGTVFTAAGFGSSLWLSVRLAAVTWLVTMVLMIPTTVYIHLRLPGLRRLLEGITILPIVIPPVVLIIGVLQVMPLGLRATVWMLPLEYVILAMPFAYRAIDAGLRAIDIKTLTEAAGSLGAGWLTTLWRVILPNLRTAVLSATILIVALVLGEFTMASLDLQQTFPVWIVLFDQLDAQMSVAASIFALLITWLLLMLITVVATRQSRRTGGGEVTLFTVAPRETIGN